MALYSRSLDYQSRATDEIHKALLNHWNGMSVEQQVQGIVAGEFLKADRDKFQDWLTFFAALDLLREDNLILSEGLSWSDESVIRLRT
jgi:hypothetical protein